MQMQQWVSMRCRIGFMLLFVAHVSMAAPLQKVIVLSSNFGSTTIRNAQILLFPDDMNEEFVLNREKHYVHGAALFLGVQKSVIPSVLSQFGLSFAVNNEISLSGNVWDGADSYFDNHTYQYKIQHHYIGLKNSLTLDTPDVIKPYLSASAGFGYNRSRDFQLQSAFDECLFNSVFQSHGVWAFSYAVGAGLQLALNQHWTVGIGYEFSDWGVSQLGALQNNTSTGSLHLSHVKTNALQLSVGYLIG